jgi:hypothetical protein
MLTIRGDVEAEWLNGVKSQLEFPTTALANTNLKSQLNAAAKLSGALYVELAGPTETVTVQDETAKEEKAREEKESKETEEAEKEGNPLILPAPTAQAPLTFTATSGKVVLESVGKSKIECKEDTATGEFTGVREGAIAITLAGCKGTSLGVACHGLGEPSETILLRGAIELVDLEKVKLILGLEISPEELKVECATVKVTIKGAVIGEVTGVESGKKTKSATAVFKKEGGKQTIKECHLTKKFCEGKKFSLEANFGKAFEEAAVEAEQKVTFAKEIAIDF